MRKHQFLLLLAALGAVLDLLIVLDNLLVCSQLEVALLEVRVGVVLDRDAWHIRELRLM